MRKLATIRKISELRPIEGADAIELAIVDGWQTVVKKGEFVAGDLAIYCEIDSWIPYWIAPFLSKGKEPREFEGIKGERLRTVKLRGALSQGLLLPMKHLTNYGADLSEGEDVSEVLGIIKYEAPIPAQLSGVVRGNWPIHIPKTDQERIQNLKKELSEWVAERAEWEVTEKLDGSSMTAYLLDGVLGVCSRNLDLKEDDNNSFWKAAKAQGLDDILYGFNANIAIQGELIGEGIQKNRYGLKGQVFYAFDIYDIDKGEYFSAQDRHDFCVTMGIKHVPWISDMHLANVPIDEYLELAEGSSHLANVEREGLVFKRCDGKVSFKAISNKFLLNGGE